MRRPHSQSKKEFTTELAEESRGNGDGEVKWRSLEKGGEMKFAKVVMPGKARIRKAKIRVNCSIKTRMKKKKV